MSDFMRDRDRQIGAYEQARAELLGLFDVGATADRYLAAIESG